VHTVPVLTCVADWCAGQELPRAYLVDTSEEALLIPDWLKLKMIRSSVSVLVDSALRSGRYRSLKLDKSLLQIRITHPPPPIPGGGDQPMFFQGKSVLKGKMKEGK
jgi:hypothetical protein